MVLLHGVLEVRVVRGHNLGRSKPLNENDQQERGYRFGDGSRFVGKKLLNALRSTNQVAQKAVSKELGAYVEVSP